MAAPKFHRSMREARQSLITGRLGDSAQCFVDGDHRYVDSGLGLRDRVLRIELSTLRIEQHQEVRYAFAVLDVGKFRGAARSLRLRAQALELRLALAVGAKAVLCVLECH